MLRSVCVVHACLCVHMCESAFMTHGHCEDTVSVSELSTLVFSEMVDTSRVITLLFLSNTHEQYTVYVQTGCEGKIINIFSYTLKYGSTTDIL